MTNRRHNQPIARALQFTVPWEGGSTITDDPDDPGGLTKFGISQKNNRDIDVANLTEEQAGQIYYERYWLPAGCEAFEFPFDLILFDMAVQHGPDNARKIFQRGVGTHDDGVFGPKTMAAFKGCQTPVINILARRVLFYVRIRLRRPKFGRKYMLGWIRRTIDLAMESAK